MRWGSPWSAGWGSPENHFLYVIPDLPGMIASGYTYIPYRFRLRPGLDNNAVVGLYHSAKFAGNVLVKPGMEIQATATIPWGATSVSIFPLRVGHLGDSSYSDEKVVRIYEGVENKRVTLQVTFSPEIVQPPLKDGGYTSAWVLNGLVQGFNCAIVNGHPTLGRLGLTITVSSGIVTVVLDYNGRPVASGSIAQSAFAVTLGSSALGAGALVGGISLTPGVTTSVVKLSPIGNSGLSGSVKLASNVKSITGGIVDARWPASLNILRDTFDPPTDIIYTLPFTGQNSVRWPDPADLPTNTYYYRTQPVSDTGKLGTQTPSVVVVTIGAPLPPTSLQYSSGGASACVLSFNNSQTAGATYRLYMATVVGGVTNLNAIQATAAAGTPGATNTIMCPNLTGYPGTFYPIVRAVTGGVEERNQNAIALEFDNLGNFKPLRPNNVGVPIQKITVTSGRTASIRGVYNPDHQAAAATNIYLYVRTAAGAYSFDANGELTGSVANAAIAASGTSGLQAASIGYTFPADGYYYATIMAKTAGGVQSPTVDINGNPLYQEVLVLVSNDTLPAGSLTAQLSRG